MGRRPKHAIMRNQMTGIRKSQSALEYMMTYGWAILIIVIVAVILYSFGIFNPSSSISTTITGFSGLGSVTAQCMMNSGLRIELGDNLGYTINITEINITSNGAIQIIHPNKIITPQGTYIFYIPNVCTGGAGSRFSIKSTVYYTEPTQVLEGPYTSTGTITGTVSSNIIPYQGVSSINYSSYVSFSNIPINANQTSFTVLLWIKANTNSDGNDFAWGTTGCTDGVYMAGGTNSIGFVGLGWTLTNVSGSFACQNVVGSAFSQQSHDQYTWAFYTIDYNAPSKTFNFYVDAQNIGTQVLTSTQFPENDFSFSELFWTEGGCTSPGCWFNGQISDFQIYNTSLSQTQINEIYLSPTFSPLPSNNLVAYYPLNGTAKDFSGHNLNGNPHDVNFGVIS